MVKDCIYLLIVECVCMDHLVCGFSYICVLSFETFHSLLATNACCIQALLENSETLHFSAFIWKCGCWRGEIESQR